MHELPRKISFLTPARNASSMTLSSIARLIGDELVGLLRVGHDAADLGRREDHRLGPLALEERAGRRLVGQVDLVDVAEDQMLVPVPLEATRDAAADQSAVARDEDAGVVIDGDAPCLACCVPGF